MRCLNAETANRLIDSRPELSKFLPEIETIDDVQKRITAGRAWTLTADNSETVAVVEPLGRNLHIVLVHSTRAGSINRHIEQLGLYAHCIGALSLTCKAFRRGHEKLYKRAGFTAQDNGLLRLDLGVCDGW